ncbi:hypothetical protein AHAS_Ahas09G0086900 [Arachis hypogaea]
MLVLIGCILEGKELYLPRLIRKFIWRAHSRGTLPFPSLVTELAQRDGVPWLPDDESPPAVYEKERVIPWGTWVSDRRAAQRRDQASTATASGPSSSSTVVGTSTAPSTSTRPAPPSSAPQPTYRLVQHLIECMDQSEHRNK